MYPGINNQLPVCQSISHSPILLTISRALEPEDQTADEGNMVFSDEQT